MAEKQESKTETPKTFDEIYAKEIREKCAAGLSKDQAIQVIRAQLEHDKALAAAPPTKPAK